MEKDHEAIMNEAKGFLEEGLLESALEHLNTYQLAVDPLLNSLLKDWGKRAAAEKEAGEVSAYRRVIRGTASLRMLRDDGMLSGEIIPQIDLPADYLGKFMLINVRGKRISGRVCLRAGDDWHLEIVKGFEQEVRDFGFEDFRINPLGGGFIDCSQQGAVTLWGTSEAFGPCRFEQAAQLLHTAFPERTVQW